jgi:hypothetical protein
MAQQNRSVLLAPFACVAILNTHSNIHTSQQAFAKDLQAYGYSYARFKQN